MKKLAIALLCFILLNQAKAQTDSNERTQIEAIFQNINKTLIPTGYLDEFGAMLMDKHFYNGVLTNDNLIQNINGFRFMLSDINSAKILPTAPTLPSLATINGTLSLLDNSTSTNLIFNISQYATLNENAVLQNQFTVSNNQIFDVAGRSQSPYNQTNFFAACPVDKNAVATNTIALTYNPSLVYSNCGKQISNVAIDFLDGSGYRLLGVGATVSNNYTDSSGYKKFAIKAVCTDGSTYYCYSQQYVNVLATVASKYLQIDLAKKVPDHIEYNTASIPHQGKVYIQFSTQRNGTAQEGKIIKPFIVVEGFDAHDLAPHINLENTSINTIIDEWQTVFDKTNYDFNQALDYDAGYDLIFIDYYTMDAIPDNANMLQKVIEWVNSEKAINGSLEQNVVMGISMGGLVSRYCLANMTRQAAANGWGVTNIKNPQTRLLITHDSPHQGANIPLGYQHFLEDFGNMTIAKYSIKSLTPELQEAETLKNQPSSQQQLIATVFNGSVQYNTFLQTGNAYRTMVDFSAGGIQPAYQFVATSQGSQCAKWVMQPSANIVNYSDVMTTLNGIFSGLLSSRYKLTAIINALPQQGTSAQISYVKLEQNVRLFWGLVGTGWTTLRVRERFSPVDILPYDCLPGGTRDFAKMDKNGKFLPLEDALNIRGSWGDLLGFILLNGRNSLNVKFNQSAYGIVPINSSLDIQNTTINTYNQPHIFPINGQAGSRATKYITQESFSSDGGGSFYNKGHTDFTKRNAKWIYNVMENIPTNTSDLDCLQSNQCFNTNNFEISGSDVICNNGLYGVTNLNTLANPSVNWVTYPQYLTGGVAQNLSCQNCTSTVLTKQNNEVVQLVANISTGCSTIVITKSIATGPPPIADFTLINMPSNKVGESTLWDFVAPIYPGVNYSWFVNSSIASDNLSGNFVTLQVPCAVSLSVRCKLTNKCGSQFSKIIKTPPGFCKRTKNSGFSTFPIDQLMYAPLKMQVAVATNSSELFGHLFYDKQSLANEMIQGVNVYNKAGLLVLQSDNINTKSTTLDFGNMANGTYLVEVLGKNDFKELHTYYYSQLNQEGYLLDEIAAGSLVINGERASDRLYVLQQKLFIDLQSNEEAMSASTILQEFATHNATNSFGAIYQIQAALGKDDITTATTLLDKWETINQIDNNFKNYYRYYIKTINNITLEIAEAETLQTIAQGCPLTDGEIVYAARDLYKYLVPTNTNDYSNSCFSISLRTQNTNKPAEKNILKSNIIYPNPSKGNITIDNLDYGTKNITVTDAYGKAVFKQQTNSKTFNINLKISTGVYFVNIANAKTGKTETQKLIVNN